MNARQIVFAALALDFLLLTAWVVYQNGYLGTFAELFSSWPGVLASVDLLLALTLVAGWMIADAGKLGLRVAPYLVLTLLLGSFGPLVYLVRREWALRGQRAA